MKHPRILQTGERILLTPESLPLRQEDIPVPLEQWVLMRGPGKRNRQAILVRKDLATHPAGIILPCQEFSGFRWGRPLTAPPSPGMRLLSASALISVLVTLVLATALFRPVHTDHRPGPATPCAQDPLRPECSLPRETGQTVPLSCRLTQLLSDWPADSHLDSLTLTDRGFGITLTTPDGENFIQRFHSRDSVCRWLPGEVNVLRGKNSKREQLSITGEFLPQPPPEPLPPSDQPGPPLYFWRSINARSTAPVVENQLPALEPLRILAARSGTELTSYHIEETTLTLQGQGTPKALAVFLTGLQSSRGSSGLSALNLSVQDDSGRLSLTLAPLSGNPYGTGCRNSPLKWDALLERTRPRSIRHPGSKPFRERKGSLPRTTPVTPRDPGILGWIRFSDGSLTSVSLDPENGSIKESDTP